MKYKEIIPNYVLEITEIRQCAQYSDILSELLEFIKRYKIVVLRRQNITLGQHLELMSNFGTVEDSWDIANRHLTNEKVHKIKTKASICHKRGSSEYWHIDSSFKLHPTLYVGLHCVELGFFIPKTLFLDLEVAYQELPSDMKNQLEQLQAKHSYQMRFVEFRKKGGVPQDIISQEINKFPDVTHKIVRVHPITGVKILFFSELCIKEICGVSYEESNKLLKYLYVHVTNKKYLYEHQWQKGDFLLYDNQSLMHKREYRYLVGHRILHRVSVS